MPTHNKIKQQTNPKNPYVIKIKKQLLQIIKNLIPTP